VSAAFITRRAFPEEPVAQVDTQDWIAAARQYRQLRRQCWRSFAGFIATAAVVGLPLAAWGDQMNPMVRDVLGVALLIALVACFAGAVTAWIALLRSRCPRCQGSFVLAWWGSWPTSRCRHCGLDLGTTESRR
jgi:4-amino-4-deoxy-L-arabinose transferase-like glycosyltransferase